MRPENETNVDSEHEWPDYSECTPAKPDKDADYHEAAERVGGETPNEKYRCATCGAEWEV